MCSVKCIDGQLVVMVMMVAVVAVVMLLMMCWVLAYVMA